MAKFIDVTALDALLDVIATGATLTLNTVQPTTRAQALSDALVSVPMTSADFTKFDGIVSGRRLAVAQKANQPVVKTGSVTHATISNGTRVLAVTTVVAQALTTGNTITIPTWNITSAVSN